MNFNYIQLKMSPLFGGYGWLDLGKIWSKVESELVTCINMFQASMGMGWKQKWIVRGNPCGPTLRLCFFSFSQSGIPKTPMPGQYQIIIDRVESAHNWYIYIYTFYTLTIIARPFCLPTSFPPGMSHSLLAEVMRPIHAPANCAFGMAGSTLGWSNVWPLMAEYDGNMMGTWWQNLMGIWWEWLRVKRQYYDVGVVFCVFGWPARGCSSWCSHSFRQ